MVSTYGGLVAAPVFSQVVQQTLNRLGVLPDVEVQSQIISTEPGELESLMSQALLHLQDTAQALAWLRAQGVTSLTVDKPPGGSRHR